MTSSIIGGKIPKLLGKVVYGVPMIIQNAARMRVLICEGFVLCGRQLQDVWDPSVQREEHGQRRCWNPLSAGHRGKYSHSLSSSVNAALVVPVCSSFPGCPPDTSHPSFVPGLSQIAGSAARGLRLWADSHLEETRQSASFSGFCVQLPFLMTMIAMMWSQTVNKCSQVDLQI